MVCTQKAWSRAKPGNDLITMVSHDAWARLEFEDDDEVDESPTGVTKDCCQGTLLRFVR
jgi:hypothetical protein